VTRFGRADTAFSFATKRFGTPSDLELGTRRARAAAVLIAALPGSLYIYQGDELGLPEVEVPIEALVDPMHFRSGGVDPGRDGRRVPLPWTTCGPSFGFSRSDAPTWLPQPAGWGDYAVARQREDTDSMLSLYRSVLSVRRREPALATEGLTWVDRGPSVLSFRRGSPGAAHLECLVNFGPGPVAIPPEHELLLSSRTIRNNQVEPDDAVWLRPPTSR
jgi:alpha-glucosidase